MLNIALLKPAIALLLLASITAGTYFYIHHYGEAKYQAGFDSAVTQYQQKETQYINSAARHAFELSSASQLFEHDVNEKLNKVLTDEIKSPIDHSCVDAGWLLDYNYIAGSSGQAD